MVFEINLSMAPRKRQKGISSSIAEPEQEYDRTKFVSFGAQKKYVENSVKRKMIQEKIGRAHV